MSQQQNMSTPNSDLSPPLLVVGVLALLVTACQTTPDRPEFYPNAHYNKVGQQQANRDVDDCMDAARDHGVAENADGQVAEKATTGAIVGGVTAGAWGLVRGDAGSRAAAGAAAGAAGGTASGAIDTTKTNPTFRNFVRRCLADQGYEIIGWQ